MLAKQKSLFSEKVADDKVINSLMREIKRLKGEEVMSKVIKSVDGQYYLMEDYEELSEEQVQAELAAKQQELAELEAIAPANEVEEVVVTETIVEATPADAPAPAAEPAPTPPADQPAAPDAPVAPTDQSAAEATPPAETPPSQPEITLQ